MDGWAFFSRFFFTHTLTRDSPVLHRPCTTAASTPSTSRAGRITRTRCGEKEREREKKTKGMVVGGWVCFFLARSFSRRALAPSPIPFPPALFFFAAPGSRLHLQGQHGVRHPQRGGRPPGFSHPGRVAARAHARARPGRPADGDGVAGQPPPAAAAGGDDVPVRGDGRRGRVRRGERESRGVCERKGEGEGKRWGGWG